MQSRYVGNRLMRCGYTTGSCAAAASKAAAVMLLGGGEVSEVEITTPSGVALRLEIADVSRTPGAVSCAVKKDSGDDPDATNGVLVYSRVAFREDGVNIDGGAGVGRVTKPGLDQPVGNAAINSVPRAMIRRAVMDAAEAYGYGGGFDVVISIPEGERIAKRTFNPRLGIEGGISVLGTSGIVEPMSEKALVDTIRAEMSVLYSSGERNLLLVVGNYAETFCREKLGLKLRNYVKCSNFIGDALDIASELGFETVLLVGHIGKLVKLGAGLFNTHSRYGDARMEILLSAALEAGAGIDTLRGISEQATADAALNAIGESGLLDRVMEILLGRIERNLYRRVPEKIAVAALCFTNDEKIGGVLGKTEKAEELLRFWK